MMRLLLARPQPTTSCMRLFLSPPLNSGFKGDACEEDTDFFIIIETSFDEVLLIIIGIRLLIVTNNCKH